MWILRRIAYKGASTLAWVACPGKLQATTGGPTTQSPASAGGCAPEGHTLLGTFTIGAEPAGATAAGATTEGAAPAGAKLAGARLPGDWAHSLRWHVLSSMLVVLLLPVPPAVLCLVVLAVELRWLVVLVAG